MIKYELKTKIPTLNEYIDAINYNRHKGNNFKQAYMNEIMWLIKAQKVKKVKGKVDVYLTFIEKDTNRDKDNIISCGFKFIMDSLVNLDIIKDDSWKYINQSYLS